MNPTPTLYRGFSIHIYQWSSRDPRIYAGTADNGDYELNLSDPCVGESSALDAIKGLIDEHLDGENLTYAPKL